MVEINQDTFTGIFQNPFATAVAASLVAMLYFFLMTISPNLPPAIVFSMLVGYFVYVIQSQQREQK